MKIPHLAVFSTLALLALLPGARGQITPSFSVLHNFTASEGADVSAGLVLGADSNLYGVAFKGGAYNAGSIFQLNVAFRSFNSFYSFNPVQNAFINSDGAAPYSRLLQGSDGNLYGTTTIGGNSQPGTIFKVALAPTLSVTYLRRFDPVDQNGANHDGSIPNSALVEGKDGSFYGIAEAGGTSAAGTIFKISPSGTFKTLFNFSRDGQEGFIPSGDIILATDGLFYGTALKGGKSGNGTVFRFTADGAVAPVHDFAGGTEGKYPSGVIQGTDGNFYGGAYSSDPHNSGTIFKLSVTGALTTLYTFSALTDGINGDGANPNGVIEGPDGNFYGTTSEGGSYGAGVAFQLTPSGRYTVLHTFSAVALSGANADGANPVGAFLRQSDFYGTTSGGGSTGSGTIFTLSLLPTITSAQSATAVVGQPFSFQCTGTNNPTSFNVDAAVGGDLPPGLSLDTATGLISGTPTQAGAFPVTLFVYNAFGGGSFSGGSATFTVTVNSPPTQPVPVITSAPSGNAAVGQPYSFQIVATNQPTSYSASGLPPGISLNAANGLISGVPTTAGDYSIQVSAAHAGGLGSSVAGSLTVTSDVTVAPPVISSAADATAQIGQPFSYQISAFGTPTFFGASGLPAGLMLDPATGLISGTPTVSGTFSIALSATNAGGAGAATLSLTVTSVVVPTVTAVIKGSGFAYEGGSSGKVLVQRSGDVSAPLTVLYMVKGTARAGIDYLPLSGSVTIPAGAMAAKLKIKSIDNETVDGTRKAKVTLLAAPDGSYLLGAAVRAKIRIVDND